MKAFSPLLGAVKEFKKKTVSSLLMTVFLCHRQEDLFHCFGLRDPTLDTNQYLC